LNDDDMAEWGYISIKELEDNDAVMDQIWKPKKFKEINLEEICENPIIKKEGLI